MSENEKFLPPYISIYVYYMYAKDVRDTSIVRISIKNRILYDRKSFDSQSLRDEAHHWTYNNETSNK